MYIYNYICHIVDFRCCCRCVVVVQVGECVINDLGTVVVVVVVVAVVVVAVSHHAFQSIHTCIIMHPMCSCIRYSWYAIHTHCIFNPYVNLCQNQSCQFQTSSANSNVYCHVNFKIQQSCQPQILTFLSNSSSCSYVNQIRSICKYNLFRLAAKWLVRAQEQLVPVNLSLFSVKQPVRVQEQLAPMFLFPVGRVTSSRTRTARAF